VAEVAPRETRALHVIITDRTTGEILREVTIDPDPTTNPVASDTNPRKEPPRQGGMKKGYRYPKKQGSPGTPDNDVRDFTPRAQRDSNP
jgi:hypothetical protein